MDNNNSQDQQPSQADDPQLPPVADQEDSNHYAGDILQVKLPDHIVGPLNNSQSQNAAVAPHDDSQAGVMVVLPPRQETLYLINFRCQCCLDRQVWVSRSELSNTHGF